MSGASQPDIYDLLAEDATPASAPSIDGLPIGEYRTHRLICGAEHLPGCWNPNLGVTACICGTAWWAGQVGTWHSIPRRAPEPALPLLGIGIGAPGASPVETEFYGWDTYFIHTSGCPHRQEDRDSARPCASRGGTCRDAEPTDYASAIKAAREEASA